jgi:hypothetical protein
MPSTAKDSSEVGKRYNHDRTITTDPSSDSDPSATNIPNSNVIDLAQTTQGLLADKLAAMSMLLL